MKKSDLKNATIVGSICLGLCSLFTYVFLVSLTTLITVFASLDFSFLLDDDLSDYEDVQITITIVPDENKVDIPIVQKIEPEHQYYPRRFHSHPHSRITDSWIPQSELDCVRSDFLLWNWMEMPGERINDCAFHYRGH